MNNFNILKPLPSSQIHGHISITHVHAICTCPACSQACIIHALTALLAREINDKKVVVRSLAWRPWAGRKCAEVVLPRLRAPASTRQPGDGNNNSRICRGLLFIYLFASSHAADPSSLLQQTVSWESDRSNPIKNHKIVFCETCDMGYYQQNKCLHPVLKKDIPAGDCHIGFALLMNAKLRRISVIIKRRRMRIRRTGLRRVQIRCSRSRLLVMLVTC